MTWVNGAVLAPTPTKLPIAEISRSAGRPRAGTAPLWFWRRPALLSRGGALAVVNAKPKARLRTENDERILVRRSSRESSFTWSWEPGTGSHTACEDLTELEGEHKDPNAGEVIARPVRI